MCQRGSIEQLEISTYCMGLNPSTCVFPTPTDEGTDFLWLGMGKTSMIGKDGNCHHFNLLREEKLSLSLEEERSGFCHHFIKFIIKFWFMKQIISTLKT